jgi:hypothetical protein
MGPEYNYVAQSCVEVEGEEEVEGEIKGDGEGEPSGNLVKILVINVIYTNLF